MLHLKLGYSEEEKKGSSERPVKSKNQLYHVTCQERLHKSSHKLTRLPADVSESSMAGTGKLRPSHLLRRSSPSSTGNPAPMLSNSQQIILSSLLSQQSPRPLPYNDDAKLLIQQHLLSLTQSLPSLRVCRDTFVHNDGNSVSALQVAGTFPMTHKGVKYNMPVTIWLLEKYPMAAPRVFVTPAKDMVIKRGHTHVDASGLVSVPYLQSWVYPISNLLGLVRSLSTIFGQDPPVYSCAPARSGVSHRARGGQSGESPAGHAAPAASSSYPTSTSTPKSAVSHSPSQARRTENPSDVFKRNAISALEERLRKDLLEVRKTQEAEMDRMMTVQVELKQREKELRRGVQETKCEREGLERQTKLLLARAKSLEEWLETNVKPDLEIDIDEVFNPCDVLSKQLLECISADLAIEDTLYSLDKAVQDGLIPIDKYFKQVRSLAREQFFHRALSAKIQLVQQDKQVARSDAESGSWQSFR